MIIQNLVILLNLMRWTNEHLIIEVTALFVEQLAQMYTPA